MKVFHIFLTAISIIALVIFIVLWSSSGAENKKLVKTIAEANDKITVNEKTITEQKNRLNKLSDANQDLTSKLAKADENLKANDKNIEQLNTSLREATSKRDELAAQLNKLEKNENEATKAKAESSLYIDQIGTLEAEISLLNDKNEKLAIQLIQIKKDLDRIRQQSNSTTYE